METSLLWFIAINTSLQFILNAFMHGETEKQLLQLKNKLDTLNSK